MCQYTSAVSIVSGVAYSEKNKSDIRLIGKTAHKYILLFICPYSLIFLIFANPMAGFLVTDNSQLQELVAFAIRIFSVEIIAEILITSRISYLAATSKTRKADILTICQRLIFIVPCVLIMGAIFGVKGIIASFAISGILLLVAIYIYYALKLKKVKLSPNDYLLLDESFDSSPKNTIILDIRDLQDAALVAEQIQLFCKGHKFDFKRAYRAALCMEETIFSLYSENDDKIPEGLEIYCTIRNDDLIMRFRYNDNISNCFSDLINETIKDPFDKIGIRIIKKTAKEIKTFCVFKMYYVVIQV